MKSILKSSHFRVRMIISWDEPPKLWCSTFTSWKLGHVAINIAISFFIPFTNISPANQGTSWWPRVNGISKTMGVWQDSFPQVIYIRNTQTTLIKANFFWFIQSRIKIILGFHILHKWFWAIVNHNTTFDGAIVNIQSRQSIKISNQLIFTTFYMSNTIHR